MKFISLDGKKVYPSKIVCIGRNYVDHIKELGNEMPSQPVIFVKPNSAISETVRSNEAEPIHYEAEITFVVSAGQLTAVGLGLDLTKRELQSRLKSKGLPWERSKCFDGAAVFSSFVACGKDTDQLRLELYINDRLIQQGGCELMINKPDAILLEVGAFMSFEDGDLIMTGTPAGVGVVNRGDQFTGKIFDKDTLLVEASWTVQ
jgi:2-keto-4-pentenoate hydratase/2-oxohepta-3-ene-1,7-dioic acid hydratase in catechol pathway